MFDHGAYPRLEPGHHVTAVLSGSRHVSAVFIAFVHVCPGENCAVERWLARKVQREEYQSLEPSESVLG